MRYLPELGIAAPEFGWVPSPTFVLRRAAILARMSDWQPGHVLEVGCGSGAILYELARRGFSGLGVETSDRARHVAEHLVAGFGGFEVSTALPVPSESFDYLLSFEVLEHIEDDIAALRQWVERLKPGGKCLLSVPAHRDRWDITDIMAGHFRRYDKDDVVKIVADAGLQLTQIETYGWPASWLIANLRRVVRSAQVKSGKIKVEHIELGDAQRTGESGIERSVELRLFPIYGSWVGRKLMQLATQAQRPFTQTDWGISYLVMAEKR